MWKPPSLRSGGRKRAGSQSAHPTCYDARRPNGAPHFRCKACQADFSITSGTLSASRKLWLRSYLVAIAIFCNEVKGNNALALPPLTRLPCGTIAATRFLATLAAPKLEDMLLEGLCGQRIKNP